MSLKSYFKFIANYLHLLEVYTLTIIKNIFYYLFLIFLYKKYVSVFYVISKKIELYLIRNQPKFFSYIEVKFNQLKLLLYGSSDVYPKLTADESFALLVKIIFYLFNIPLILSMRQPPTPFF